MEGADTLEMLTWSREIILIKCKDFVGSQPILSSVLKET